MTESWSEMIDNIIGTLPLEVVVEEGQTNVESSILEVYGEETLKSEPFIAGLLAGLRGGMLTANLEEWVKLVPCTSETCSQDYHAYMDISVITSILLDNAKAVASLHGTLKEMDELGS